MFTFPLFLTLVNNPDAYKVVNFNLYQLKDIQTACKALQSPCIKQGEVCLAKQVDLTTVRKDIHDRFFLQLYIEQGTVTECYTCQLTYLDNKLTL